MTEDKRIRVLSPPQYVKAHDDHMSLAEISTALDGHDATGYACADCVCGHSDFDADHIATVLADYVRERGERIPNEQL